MSWPVQLPSVSPRQELPQWYAVQTRSRHEKKVVLQLENKRVATFLPLVSEVHRWSDRQKVIQVPLFPGYVFLHMVTASEARRSVLHTPGVVGFVGSGGAGIPIPDKQIEDLQTLLSHNVPCTLYPLLRVGQRVRIRGGCLNGIEGTLLVLEGRQRLAISVDSIPQSVTIRIEGYQVEVLAPPPPVSRNATANNLSVAAACAGRN